MKAAVCSFKFSPGHLSHLRGYAKLLNYIGYDVVFWLELSYKSLMEKEEQLFESFWFNSKTEPQLVNCDLLIVVNPSVYNHKIARLMKERYSTKILYLYHEPWDSLNHYLLEGISQTLKATVAHYYSTKMLRVSDVVIVPSQYAAILYEKHDKRFNSNYRMIPLLFDDELDKEINISKKAYFSYIGPAVKGHAFDKYIEFIKFVSKKMPNVRFEIATRTNLSYLLHQDTQIRDMVNRGILTITHNRPLTTYEINLAYQRSICVWNIYRRSTQSGVLPKAFMFGTPVIATSIGSFPEYIVDGYNGFLVKEYNPELILEKVKCCYKNIKELSKNCRESFQRYFYWKSYTEQFRLLILNQS